MAEARDGRRNESSGRDKNTRSSMETPAQKAARLDWEAYRARIDAAQKAERAQAMKNAAWANSLGKQDYNITAKALGLTTGTQPTDRDPQNQNRLDQNRQLKLQGLAKDAAPKKNALKKMLEKLKGGKGGRLGGIPGGGGVMPYDVR
jgi:hypothetical protein